MREISSMQFESINYANYAIAYKQPNISFILQRYFLRPFNIRKPPPPSLDKTIGVYSQMIFDTKFSKFTCNVNADIDNKYFYNYYSKNLLHNEIFDFRASSVFSVVIQRWHAVSDLIKSIQDILLPYQNTFVFYNMNLTQTQLRTCIKVCLSGSFSQERSINIKYLREKEGGGCNPSLRMEIFSNEK